MECGTYGSGCGLHGFFDGTRLGFLDGRALGFLETRLDGFLDGNAVGHLELDDELELSVELDVHELLADTLLLLLEEEELDDLDRGLVTTGENTGFGATVQLRFLLGLMIRSTTKFLTLAARAIRGAGILVLPNFRIIL